MNSKVIVDTSCFIGYLRDGKDSAIPALAIADAILLSAVVRLELLKGARRSERRALLHFLDGLSSVSEFPPVAAVESLLLLLHGRGLNLGMADLMILADARQAKCRLMTFDSALAEGARVVNVRLAVI